MTETKYILTGDESHVSGNSLREWYADTEFPIVCRHYHRTFKDDGDIYEGVRNDSHYMVSDDSEVRPQVTSVGSALWFFVTKDGERISMPTPVSYDFSFGENTTVTPTTFNRDALNTYLGFDPVDKPEHYNTNLPEGVEAIDIIAAQTENLSGLRAVCHANVLKYALRWQKKNGVEDLKKARTYIDWLIKEIENNG